MADNKVRFGLSNCYYATITESNGATTYGTPVAMPGAVALNLESQMSTEDFYADNGVYYVSSSANSYEGDLELATIPRSFLKDIFGDAEDANGALFEVKESRTNYFALMFETDGDVGGHRVVMYKCSATRPALGGNTKTDSVEVQTQSMTIKAIARVDESTIKATTSGTATVGHAIQASVNVGDTGYDDFFESVYSPVTPT
jgi:phi13 family phage major tail protein